MDIEKKKNEIDITVIQNFPTKPKLFEYLGLMFKNYFSGTDIWENVEIDEYSNSGKWLEKRFHYYKNIYDLIQKYWSELKDVFNCKDCITISQVVLQPGEVFILLLKNDSLTWQTTKDLDKSVCRNLSDAWNEYTICKGSGVYTKKLDKIIKRIKKKSGNNHCENDFILNMIVNVLSIEDKKFFNNLSDDIAYSTARHLRNLRNKL